MKLGVYTACPHDKTLDETLSIIAGLGLTSLEANTGGFASTSLGASELSSSSTAVN